jgi:hypothetical protein
MKVLLKGVKNSLFLCLIVAATVNYLPGGYQSGAAIDEEIMDWDKVMSAFDVFLEYPSPENTKAFMDSIPKDETKNESGDASKTIDHIIDAFSYGILENEIWAGNRYAVEAAFRLLNFSDGEFAEDLCTTLGTLIRINPRLFLEVLYEYKNSWFVKEVGPPVHNLGYAYVDRLKAQQYELRMRIKALESISDPKYMEIRKACIDQLLKDINKY